MVDSIFIRNKYTEYSALYANRHIDDYDTFICARVADYYINQGCASTDTIYTEIEEALCEPITDGSGNDNDDNNEMADEVERNVECSNKYPSLTSLKKDSVFSKITKGVPCIVGAGAAFVGVITWIVRRKSGNTHK